jgi:hypothetical protein
VVLTALFRCMAALFVVLTCLWTVLPERDWFVLTALFRTCLWLAVLLYRVLLRVAVAFFTEAVVVRLLYLGSPVLDPLTLPVVSLDR